MRSERVFSTFPIGAKRKNTLGIEFTISVSCHHFGWAFPTSEKSLVDEDRPIAFKTRFLNFPYRGETKKHPWDRILQFRFFFTILGGLFQAAKKAGLTKVVQFQLKTRFFNFPHLGETKKYPWDRILQFRFYATILWWAFSSSEKSRVDEGRPISIKNAFFQLSPSGRNEKTPFGSNFTISVLCHHFWWAFPSSEKSRVDEGRPIAFKTRFLNFPHRGET